MARFELENNWAEIIFEDQQYPIIKYTSMTMEEYDLELTAIASSNPPDNTWVNRILEDSNGPVIIHQVLTEEEYNEEVRAMLGIKGELLIFDNSKVVLSKVS